MAADAKCAEIFLATVNSSGVVVDASLEWPDLNYVVDLQLLFISMPLPAYRALPMEFEFRSSVFGVALLNFFSSASKALSSTAPFYGALSKKVCDVFDILWRQFIFY